MSSARLQIVPMTVKGALYVVRQWHRHLPDLQGGLFACGVTADGDLCGVAVAGNPARRWQGTARLVISRVATDETRNACSKLYGAICRAAEALGYREVWTYTLPEESTESIRGAGFVDMGLTNDGDEWSRVGRPRSAQRRPEAKRRWRRVLHPR